MKRVIPITPETRQIIEQHGQAVQAARSNMIAMYTILLSQHGITQFDVTGVSDTELTLEVPDAAPEPSAPTPISRGKSRR